MSTVSRRDGIYAPFTLHLFPQIAIEDHQLGALENHHLGRVASARLALVRPRHLDPLALLEPPHADLALAAEPGRSGLAQEIAKSVNTFVASGSLPWCAVYSRQRRT